MSRILFVLVLLLITGSSLAGADIFKCTRPGGEVFFTDSPASGECMLEKISAPPPVSVAPVSPQPQPPVPIAKRPDVPKASTNNAELYDALKGEAQRLVDRFEDARRRSIRYSLVVQKKKAQHEMTDIRREKITLLGKIDQSALNDSEKQELAGRLSSITE
jgi:hypothetical protein